MKTINALALTALLGFSPLTAATYNVDTVSSTIGFKVRHLMVSYVRGSFKEYKGHYDYDAKTKKLSALEGTVQIASVDTNNIDRNKNILESDFFDVKKYPQMKLKLIKHTDEKVLVSLSIKDVTKEVELTVEDLSDEAKDFYGNFKTGFSLKGNINRKAFNLSFHKTLDTGGVAVGDNIKIILDLEGTKVKDDI